jgi:hypothetical protein
MLHKAIKVNAVEKPGQASSTYIEQKCHMFSHTASYRTTLSQLQAAVTINPKALDPGHGEK